MDEGSIPFTRSISTGLISRLQLNPQLGLNFFQRDSLGFRHHRLHPNELQKHHETDLLFMIWSLGHPGAFYQADLSSYTFIASICAVPPVQNNFRLRFCGKIAPAIGMYSRPWSPKMSTDRRSTNR
jgi:hypothetical protein